ncbi:MAG: Hemin transport protein [Lysobacter sp.]|nr:Hemin transport protein [Lysobacter sp.]
MDADSARFTDEAPTADVVFASTMPSMEDLATLGPVLCVFCERYGGELGGWLQAASAYARCGIETDGWYECLSFRDRENRDCWRLYLLPESDFFAWDRVRDRLPRGERFDPFAKTDRKEGSASMLWRRSRNCETPVRWGASVLRLHALRPADHAVLAASPWRVSSLGGDIVRRVMRIEGIQSSSVAL